MKTKIELQRILEAAMKEKGVTQAQVAGQTRINKSTLHGYLYGAIPKGTIALIKIADYFDLSLDELVFGKTRASKGELGTRNEQRFELIIREK